MERNYLPVGDKLSVAGIVLKPNSATPQWCDFEVVIPASYKMISPHGNLAGILDGVPYDGARFLEAGPHTFESSSPFGRLVLLWAQAVDRHFRPLGYQTWTDNATQVND